MEYRNTWTPGTHLLCWKVDGKKQSLSSLPYQRSIKRIGTRYQFCGPWIYNPVFGRSIIMITTMEQFNCIDSSLFIFNCSFRFGVLSDFMQLICWLLQFSFANLKTLAHLENFEWFSTFCLCCLNTWFIMSSF